ncbi:MAG: hypothetical protein MJE12_20870 [Alphaproteobacteria bacterium]|nr:hypothetical protein [Alphaproteobacteria bacterium]
MMRGIVFALVLVLAGCVSTDYTGKTYPPTTKVDLYFPKDKIDARYETMGEIRETASRGVSFKSMEQKLVKEAMARGADAVLIEKLDTTAVPGLNDRPAFYIQRDGTLRPSGPDSELTIVRKDHVITAQLLKYRK